MKIYLGFGGVSSLDLLSTSGMVNYFGKCLDLTEIYIRPILLRKGKSQLALYGLSYIHDNRLARLFHESKVIMEQPDKEQTGKWFNMLVLHQNRADRGLKNYLPESILPEFLDLVMWGHEHDCRIEPEENPTKNFFVTQPGSSVATSLAEGEAIDKHVGLLEIYEGQFKLTPIKLQTVRPFIFESVNLIDMVDELGLDEHDAGVKVRDKVAFCAASCLGMLTTVGTLQRGIEDILGSELEGGGEHSPEKANAQTRRDLCKPFSQYYMPHFLYGEYEEWTHCVLGRCFVFLNYRYHFLSIWIWKYFTFVLNLIMSGPGVCKAKS